MFYSRKSFAQPQLQQAPHQNFQQEVSFYLEFQKKNVIYFNLFICFKQVDVLDDFFPGTKNCDLRSFSSWKNKMKIWI